MSNAKGSHLEPLSRLIAAAVASVFSTGCGGSGKVSGDASVPEPEAGGDATMMEADAAAETASGAEAGNDAPPCAKQHGAILSSTPAPSDAGPEATVIWTITYAVDPTCCAGQLVSVSAPAALGGPGPDIDAGYACDYTVENPCASAPDGSIDCSDWCVTAAPPNTQPGCGRCQGIVTDAGIFGDCLGSCGSACGFGRPPRGFVPRRVRASSALASGLARMAQLERASVVAFDALHADLVRVGAPRSLLRAVRRARGDEVRHERMATNAAGRAGARVPPVDIAPLGPRGVEALAIDNAQEGCVRETFGAALALVQAEQARNEHVRRMMRGIAHDELRHAALSWDLARWLESRLDRRGRARVRQARRTAIRALSAELGTPFAAHGSLGMPDSASQRRLLQALRPALERGITA